MQTLQSDGIQQEGICREMPLYPVTVVVAERNLNDVSNLTIVNFTVHK